MSMFKNFLMKQMVKKQLKGYSEEQKDQILKVVESNPEIFEKIATEIQAKVKSGKGQMEASIEVMKKYQNELRDIMAK